MKTTCIDLKKNVESIYHLEREKMDDKEKNCSENDDHL